MRQRPSPASLRSAPPPAGGGGSDAAMTKFIHIVVLFSAYAVLWFLCLFCLLPIGLGSERDPDSGAPLNPMLKKKALIASVIAAVIWVGFYAAIRFSWLEL
jgi:predicted secreted protein